MAAFSSEDGVITPICLSPLLDGSIIPKSPRSKAWYPMMATNVYLIKEAIWFVLVGVGIPGTLRTHWNSLVLP